jgi:hypothetical protein
MTALSFFISLSSFTFNEGSKTVILRNLLHGLTAHNVGEL